MSTAEPELKTTSHELKAYLQLVFHKKLHELSFVSVLDDINIFPMTLIFVMIFHILLNQNFY